MAQKSQRSDVMKTCSTCKAFKTKHEFYKKGDGFESSCKTCKTRKKREAYRSKASRVQGQTIVRVLNDVSRYLDYRTIETIHEINELICAAHSEKEAA